MKINIIAIVSLNTTGIYSSCVNVLYNREPKEYSKTTCCNIIVTSLYFWGKRLHRFIVVHCNFLQSYTIFVYTPRYFILLFTRILQ